MKSAKASESAAKTTAPSSDSAISTEILPPDRERWLKCIYAGLNCFDSGINCCECSRHKELYVHENEGYIELFWAVLSDKADYIACKKFRRANSKKKIQFWETMQRRMKG